jgi:hypothetical protein
VRLAGGLKLLVACRGELRVHHSPVGRTCLTGDEARALQPVEEPRDPGGGEQDAGGEIDPAHGLFGRPRKVQQHLEVVDRQPVIGHELGVQLPDDCRMRPQEAHPRVEFRAA